MSNTINFFVPINENSFQKGTNAEGKECLMVEGICSTSDRDKDDQTLQPIGFNVKPLIKAGFINWNHTAKKDPNGIIGEPVEVSFNPNGDMFVKAMLYDIPKARAVYNLAKTLSKSKTGRQLGWSIEGIPTEVDPLDPNNILKADITGIAITPSPKNPSTYLQICKGEEVQEFTFDQQEIDEMNDFIEKAMSAEENLHTSEESVEGGRKKLKKQIDVDRTIDKDKKNEDEDDEDREALTKSEVASLIVKKIPKQSLESYKIIHTFMAEKNINTNMELTKALDQLGALLEKGEESAELDSTTTDAEDPIEEEEGSDNDSDSLEEDENLGEIAKGMYVGGMTRSQLTEAMIRGGYELEKSLDTVELVFDTLQTTPGNIADKQVLDKIAVLEKGMGLLVKSISTLVKNQAKTPTPVAIEKGSDIQVLTDRFTKIEDQLKQIGRQSTGRKSVTSAPVERFEKGQDPTVLDGKQVFSLRTQKNELVQTLFDLADQARMNNVPDHILEKAVSEIELNAFNPLAYASKLNALKIAVIQ